MLCLLIGREFSREKAPALHGAEDDDRMHGVERDGVRGAGEGARARVHVEAAVRESSLHRRELELSALSLGAVLGCFFKSLVPTPGRGFGCF